MLIDSHSHIDGAEFQLDIDEVFARMKEAEVGGALVAGTSLQDYERGLNFANAHKNVCTPPAFIRVPRMTTMKRASKNSSDSLNHRKVVATANAVWTTTMRKRLTMLSSSVLPATSRPQNWQIAGNCPLS